MCTNETKFRYISYLSHNVVDRKYHLSNISNISPTRKLVCWVLNQFYESPGCIKLCNLNSTIRAGYWGRAIMKSGLLGIPLVLPSIKRLLIIAQIGHYC